MSVSDDSPCSKAAIANAKTIEEANRLEAKLKAGEALEEDAMAD